MHLPSALSVFARLLRVKKRRQWFQRSEGVDRQLLRAYCDRRAEIVEHKGGCQGQGVRWLAMLAVSGLSWREDRDLRTGL
jgi:hypothetical protein